jgi:RraA family protein
MTSIGFRIKATRANLSRDLVARAARLPASNIGDVMSRNACMVGTLRPYGRPGLAVAGPAFTVRVRAGDNLMLHKALDIAAPGDVVVCDAGGFVQQAIMGEIMVRYAMSRKIAAVIIDGAIRDADSLAQLDFPIYAYGVTPAGPYKDGPGEIGYPVACGGQVVQPGDLIVGDGDGIVVVPQAEVEAVIAEAEAHNAKEVKTMAAIATGTVDRSWVDATLKARGCHGVA